jgi:cytochrome b
LNAKQAPARQRIWDPFVRVFHWSLVGAYVLAWATAEEWDLLHERLGWFLLALLGLRLVWGLIGTRYARFGDLLRGPGEVRAYLGSLLRGDPEHHAGHNPAGGWMVLALIATLAATALSGVLITRGGEAWEDLHEGLAGLSLVLVGVHVLGVLVSSFLHRENLVKTMLTGNKPGRNVDV